MSFKTEVAKKQNVRLKVNFSGLSGSGKTLSSLLVAKGLMNGDVSKIGVLQTEAGRANCYADKIGDFSICEFAPPFTPTRFIEGIGHLISEGKKVVIVDSLSDEWNGEGGALQMVDSAKSTVKNQFSAWRNVTPKHEQLFNYIMSAPVHIFTTTKKKAEYVQERENGKLVVKKVGLADVQREGSEYRFMLNFDIDRDTHLATVDKDNTGLFYGKDPYQLTEAVGMKLREWCLS